MSKEILINVEAQERRLAIIKEGKLEEYFIERPQYKTIVGNIYKGRVKSVVASIGAAFVDIGKEKNGFLYLSEKPEHFLEQPVEEYSLFNNQIHKDQELLVQVVKESFGTKGPRITTHISIPGRYLVLMPQDRHIGISRRIESDVERARLLGLLSSLPLPKDVGFIVRTAAVGCDKRQLLRDMNFLTKLWRGIIKNQKRKKSPSITYEEYDLSLRIMRDSFTEDVNKVIVDNYAEYRRIVHFIKSFLPHLVRRVEFYSKDAPLFEEHKIEEEIEKIFGNRVFLDCGGYLVIEPTEGLVVIDVNSGRFKKKTSTEDMAFSVNRQAALEAARQIRLRDLGGIIVIDFIDMMEEKHRREIFRILKDALKNDSAKADILGISKFGLVEMTRERVYRTVESLSYTKCPYCEGKGRIKSVTTISINIIRSLRQHLKSNPKRELNIYLNPKVAEYLLNQNKFLIERLEKQFKNRIFIFSDPLLHVEQSRFS
ncbi:MAG: Rne/Rng family ribonuclease [Candidatus Omnitrophota bacterium]